MYSLTRLSRMATVSLTWLELHVTRPSWLPDNNLGMDHLYTSYQLRRLYSPYHVPRWLPFRFSRRALINCVWVWMCVFRHNVIRPLQIVLSSCFLFPVLFFLPYRYPNLAFTSSSLTLCLHADRHGPHSLIHVLSALGLMALTFPPPIHPHHHHLVESPLWSTAVVLQQVATVVAPKREE